MSTVHPVIVRTDKHESLGRTSFSQPLAPDLDTAVVYDSLRSTQVELVKSTELSSFSRCRRSWRNLRNK